MKFSIITINYNNYKGLKKTIESVIDQTYKDYEYIIIDGGSDDGSIDIIKKYSHYITYWVSEHDKGIYNAMNKGIVRAKGTYINFMNSGDAFYEKDTLAKVNALIDNDDFYIGKDYNIDPKTGKDFITILPTRISMAMFFVWTLPHQSSFIKRSLFTNSLYNEDLRIVSDWSFYLEKIVYDGKIVKLIDLIICNREQGGISNQQASKTMEERKKVLLKLLPPGIYRDYDSLAKLDRSTLYKFLNLLDKKNGTKWITIFIKILYRILKHSV